MTDLKQSVAGKDEHDCNNVLTAGAPDFLSLSLCKLRCLDLLGHFL